VTNRVVVVGAGVAGTAAALTAARAGAQVTLIDGGTGASTLATGALDAVFWPHAPAHPAPIGRAAREVLDALGGYALPDGGARLLTTSGVARPARGHDAALLDIMPLAGSSIGVVRCERPGWDGGALARAWGESFQPFDAVVIRHVDERVLPDADFAMRHDDDDRLGWLADRLRDALTRAGARIRAIVLPPCLGIDRPKGRALSERVGVACGEAIALPGGPSGLRFERARDRALVAAVDRVPGRATSLARSDDGWRIAMGDGPAREGDAVVLATGGLIGGGVEYAPAESIVASALPPFGRPPFRLTVDAPLTLGANGRPLELPGTLFGIAPESIAWPFARDALADRVGVLADVEGRTESGLFVAGDLRADSPRAWLDVLATGVAAGAAAARASRQGTGSAAMAR